MTLDLSDLMLPGMSWRMQGRTYMKRIQDLVLDCGRDDINVLGTSFRVFIQTHDEILNISIPFDLTKTYQGLTIVSKGVNGTLSISTTTCNRLDVQDSTGFTEGFGFSRETLTEVLKVGVQGFVRVLPD